MVVDYRLTDIDQAAKAILEALNGKTIVALHGTMGAGKTTLMQAIGKQLGIVDVIGSPTFSIINEYKTTDGKSVFHLDLYRLKNEAEAIEAGVEDCIFSGNLCFVEWPEIAPAFFYEDTLHCFIQSSGHNNRILQIKL